MRRPNVRLERIGVVDKKELLMDIHRIQRAALLAEDALEMLRDVTTEEHKSRQSINGARVLIARLERQLIEAQAAYHGAAPPPTHGDDYVFRCGRKDLL